ncbi:dephospho-CoA kinase [Rhodobium gokarnense]|uniref:Dephospho-CoA kinase n=1 Tax=Rhodobium gokarnense TaxID=364296 RepID=A0ABT3HE56_9HYPH|nr:dephospho-CoA kinase [Rhodobium gokarnense]MCW2308668.1 dephospho-CoA kinase [Rhodobium gokarnense]
MIVLGLTGSIGMGKSTTAAMFAAAGLPVHDADATVHRLYSGPAAPLIEAEFPGTTEDGTVDRTKLSDRVLGDRKALSRLEAIVHPLVREAERTFLRDAANSRAAAVVLDIPLLFEIGGDARVDAVVVVTADADIQAGRVLSRPGMTEDRFEQILSRQMPDAEKRRRAHFLIDSGHGFEPARRQVAGVCRVLAQMAGKGIAPDLRG